MGENEIKFDTKNYRTHSDKNKNLILKSLKKCGAGRSILIDKEGEIIAGNGVYEQAKTLNIPVKVIETDGTELIAIKRTDLATESKKRKELALFDNSASDAVEWDLSNLKADFYGIEYPLGGGTIHGKDLSKADCSVNIFCFIEANRTGNPQKAICSIGDKFVNINGKLVEFSFIVKEAKEYIKFIGGFEKLAEWGLR